MNRYPPGLVQANTITPACAFARYRRHNNIIPVEQFCFVSNFNDNNNQDCAITTDGLQLDNGRQ